MPKKKTKTKTKTNSYKNFMKSIMKKTKTKKQAVSDHKKKIEEGVGGGKFVKIDKI